MQDNKCPGCGMQWPIDFECCPMARPTAEMQWMAGRGAAPRLASPQEILEESLRLRPAPAREAGVVLARDTAELVGHVAALGQQGYRIIAVVTQEFGAGWLIVHQVWG